MKSSSSNQPILVECTNKSMGIYVVRWGVEQQKPTEENKSIQYAYQEERFTHLPAFNEVVKAIMDSNVDATSQELSEIIGVVGEDIDAAKNLIQHYIDKYDKSDEVNNFSVNGMEMWLDKQTRTSLSYTISVEEKNKSSHTTLWYEGTPPVSFEFEIEQFKQMLDALELYAKATYNVTQQHKAEVCELETIDEVLNFDIKADYPAKIEFTV